MATPDRPSKRAKLSLNSFQQQLRVIVGPPKTQMYVQKSMICDQSEFFKSACNSHWDSGKTNTITLGEENPAIFGIFLSWLYTGNIKHNEEYIFIDDKSPLTHTSFKSHWMQLVQCYGLGEMLISPNFKNAVIDSIFSKTAIKYLQTNWITIVDIEIIEQIFIGTPQGSPLRRYILETCFLKLQSKHALWAELSTSTPVMRDFLEELSKLSLKNIQKFNGAEWRIKCPWESESRCEYHEHLGEPAGYLCTDKVLRVEGWQKFPIDISSPSSSSSSSSSTSKSRHPAGTLFGSRPSQRGFIKQRRL